MVAKVADKPTLAETVRQLLRRAMIANQTVLSEVWALLVADDADAKPRQQHGAIAFVMVRARPYALVFTPSWKLLTLTRPARAHPITNPPKDMVAWFPALVVAAIGREAQALLAHDNATLASAALDLLAVAAPSFGTHLGGDRYGPGRMKGPGP